MLILGLNAYHADAAACLVRDGIVLAAAEEERFRRVKHWAGFPARAIGYCLGAAQARLGDVDHVAVNSSPAANLGRRIAYAALAGPALGMVADRMRKQRRRYALAEELEAACPGSRFRGTVHRIEHHLAHLASCYLVSPFEEAVALSLDGFGDFASAAWGPGRGSTVEIDGRIWFPHSLGIFYQALTQYLGFSAYGDEYKVMGLAAYGSPRHLDDMRRVVRLAGGGSFALDLAFFRHHRERIAGRWSGGAPEIGRLYGPPLEELLGPARRAGEPLEARHRDIACSVQAMYEEAFFHLLDALQARYGSRSLALAGGCAMNSVANGKIMRRTHFRRLYIPPAPGDAGGAIGAAVEVWHRLAGATRAAPGGEASAPGSRTARRVLVDRADLGPAWTADDIGSVLAAREEDLAAADCRAERIGGEDALLQRTAALLADGRVVGWFQGRMEWGPRALGNRSILGDPRRADMKDILNSRIKRRESFRPFAPSVQREHVAHWFAADADVPFMTEVLPVRADRRAIVPAVTHVDGSGRLHTVTRDDNPRYWRLIEAFRERTGVPMVLNTSFNESEPIVCRPEEALDCFLRTQMDALVLGDVLIART